MEKADRDDWWPRWVWVGECIFWYRLTQVVADKIHTAVKRLCVCVCSHVLSFHSYSWMVLECSQSGLQGVWCHILKIYCYYHSSCALFMFDYLPTPTNLMRLTPAASLSVGLPVFCGYCQLFIPYRCTMFAAWLSWFFSNHSRYCWRSTVSTPLSYC